MGKSYDRSMVRVRKKKKDPHQKERIAVGKIDDVVKTKTTLNTLLNNPTGIGTLRKEYQHRIFMHKLFDHNYGKQYNFEFLRVFSTLLSNTIFGFSI